MKQQQRVYKSAPVLWNYLFPLIRFDLNSYDELQTIPEDNVGMGRVYEDEKPSNAILKAKECASTSMGDKQVFPSGFRYIHMFALFEVLWPASYVAGFRR